MDKCVLLSLRQFRYLLNNSSTTNAAINCRFVHQNVSTKSVKESGITTKAKKTKTPKAQQDKNLPTEPPIRIERSPTDILKALASTVGRDYTAPAYKFHDDPFLIPMNNATKRMYALSKESGRKAAKWVRQQHPELYYHKSADPPVMDFLPDPTIQDATELNEDVVKSFINLGLLSEAIKAYEMLESKGQVLSLDTKTSLLEMAAFYNDEEPADDDFIEERWYVSSTVQRDRYKNTWKGNGVAEKLFQEVDQSNPRVCNAMIRGRAKYFNSESAFELFQNALSKGVPLETETFNSVLRLVKFLRENADLRYDLVLDILGQMKSVNVEPNIGTLTSALETASTLGNQRKAQNLALSLLSEFKSLGIKPSLGSYYFVLKTFCKDRGTHQNILLDILDEIQGQTFYIQDPSDVLFFSFTMDVARFQMQDLNVANRVHELALTGTNYDLIGDSFKESVYYRNYLIMKIQFEPIEKLFEFYDRIVPNIYTPEPAVFEELLNAIEAQGAINYMPQLWSDMVVFDFLNREELLTSFLHIMASEYPVQETEESSKLGAKFAEIAWKIWTFVETQDVMRTNPVMWTGKMLGDVLIVLVKSGQFEKACEIMKKFLSPSSKILGAASMISLQTFLHEAIKQKKGVMGLACIQYASDAGFPEVKEMAEELSKGVELDSVQKARLCSIVGFDVFSTKESLVN